MDQRICQLDDLAVYGRAGGTGRRLGRGALVDLDDEIEPGYTVRDALGRHATTKNFPPLSPAALSPLIVSPAPELPTDAPEVSDRPQGPRVRR